MPHRCVHCGKIYSDASKEILEGCNCGTRFFYYIKQERLDEIEQGKTNEVQSTIKELDKTDKVKIEKQIREITGVEEPEIPVILDLESVKVISPGKFEIDIVNLFNKKRPLIYKLEEGKYIIDLASTLKASTEEIENRIKEEEKTEGF